MCQVPTSLASLLSLLAPCFSQPTFQTFSMLLVGSVGRIRDCTVSGMLQAAGLAGSWHHSRAHDFFARRRWDPDGLGLALLDFLVTVFVRRDAVRLAVDDTLFGRSGRRVCGAHYLHDGAQPEDPGEYPLRNCWSSSCSSWSFRVSAAGRSRCLSCFACSAPRTTPIPTGPRSQGSRGPWST